MRIISGIYGGRVIAAPKSTSTRPMTDKVRAALFDILGPIDGFAVLDTYAGSGVVGFEALSRAAAQVIAVESSRQAITAIKRNQADLGITWGYSLYEMTVESYLARQGSVEQTFDLIAADPPYNQLKIDVLEKLGMLLEPDGILAVSHSGRSTSPILEGLELIQHKNYGDASLSLYRARRG